MKNILISFPYNVTNFNEYEEVLNDFEKQGYIIHNFEGIENNFHIDIIYSAVQYVKEYEGENINRIVVISNVKELIFCWFRCYNSLIDDFIYLIDSVEAEFLRKDINYSFYEKLFKFINIENESIQGKIYININLHNFKLISSFLFMNNYFRYFDSIENYKFDIKLEKTVKEKVYNYLDKCFMFYDKTKLAEEISISTDYPTKVLFDNKFFHELRKNMYFTIYFLFSIYREINYDVRSKILIYFLKVLRDEEKKNILFNSIKKYIIESDIDYQEKMYFLFYLLLLDIKDDFILQSIMESLLNEKEHLEYHYGILINTLYFINYKNIKIYKDYYNDRRKIIKQLSDTYSKYCNKKPLKQDNRSKKIRNIAILTDQLVSISHSPTKNMTLDYAINLKKYFPNLNIQIFVEDNLYCKEEIRKIMPYYYSSIISASVQEKHFGYLRQNGVDDIEIFYSNNNLSQKEKIIQMVEEVNKFEPDVILTNSDISLTRAIIYNDYPIVYMSLGELAFSTPADIYLVGSKEEALVKNEMYDFVNLDNIYNVKHGFDFHKSYKNIMRIDYDLTANDFVMITVGNRLDGDMDNNYIDLICSFMSNRRDVKWLIVGKYESYYIDRKYKDLLNNQIIRIAYEKDLVALYKICDVYLNPFRKSGGISIAMAMNEGVPIVVSSQPSDGKDYVGEENCAGYNMDGYINELQKLYDNDEYRREKQLAMKERIDKFKMEFAIKDLMEKLNIAKERFFKRKCNEYLE